MTSAHHDKDTHLQCLLEEERAFNQILQERKIQALEHENSQLIAQLDELRLEIQYIKDRPTVKRALQTGLRFFKIYALLSRFRRLLNARHEEPTPVPVINHDELRDIAALATLASEQTSARITENRIFIDTTHTISTTSITGIQRMVRQIAQHGTHYGASLLRINGDHADHWDTAMQSLRPIKPQPGDIWILPDVSWLYTEYLRKHMDALRHSEGKSIFILTDILSVTLKNAFPAHARSLFSHWLHRCVLHANAVICISKVTADELMGYIGMLRIDHDRRPDIGWVHCGVEPLAAKGEHPSERLLRLQGSPFLLSVSTIEPRKGYGVSVEAFSRLWATDIAVTFVIVGRHGWNQQSLIQYIREHPEFEKRLIWLEDVTDDELAWLYRHAHALVSASIAEGFGLPIFEAAQYGTTSIVSDIPIYREICGQHAIYFDCMDATSLYAALLDIVHKEKPVSTLPTCSWQDSVNGIFDMIKHDTYQYKRGVQPPEPRSA